MPSDFSRFVAGEPNLPPAVFAAGKAKMCEMREAHVKKHITSQAPDATAAAGWLTQRGRPTTPPDAWLQGYDMERGGSFAVQGMAGCGFDLTKVEFEQGDMITKAYDIAGTGEVKIAILNMANAELPGGGFLRGCRAQEEQLCHRSDLFVRLKLHKFGNERHIPHGTCLVTRNVDIFRDGDYEEVAGVRVAVLSAAAPYHKTKSDAQQDRGLLDHLTTTWMAIISAASAAGAQEVILGALGCGAFNNPPHTVGRALAIALRQGSPGMVQAIRVVIMEDHNSNGQNFQGFKAGFDEEVASDANANGGGGGGVKRKR